MNKFCILFILLFTAISSCSVAKSNQVIIKTEYGQIVIKLYDETPLHRDNFIKLAREKFYDGVIFHRVIKGFMIQAGDPKTKKSAVGSSVKTSNADYTIAAEIAYPIAFHKRGALAAARLADNVNPERKSSGSQFYIVQGTILTDQELNEIEERERVAEKKRSFTAVVQKNRSLIDSLQKNNQAQALNQLQQQLIAQVEKEVKAKDSLFVMDQSVRNIYKTIGGTPFLDKGYTVFGEVIEGMDVVDTIAALPVDARDKPLTDVIISVTVN